MEINDNSSDTQNAANTAILSAVKEIPKGALIALVVHSGNTDAIKTHMQQIVQLLGEQTVMVVPNGEPPPPAASLGEIKRNDKQHYVLPIWYPTHQEREYREHADYVIDYHSSEFTDLDGSRMIGVLAIMSVEAGQEMTTGLRSTFHRNAAKSELVPVQANHVIPEDLLPGVTRIPHGSLVVLIKDGDIHPATFDAHYEKLKVALTKKSVFKDVGQGLIEGDFKRYSIHSLESEKAVWRNWRERALELKTTTLVTTSQFTPRARTVEEHADFVFMFTAGPGHVMLHTVKARGVGFGETRKALQLKFVSPKFERPRHDAPINVQITCDHTHGGKSSVAAVIAKALHQTFDVPVHAYSLDGDFEKANERMPDLFMLGETVKLPTERINIFDCADRDQLGPNALSLLLKRRPDQHISYTPNGRTAKLLDAAQRLSDEEDIQLPEGILPAVDKLRPGSLIVVHTGRLVDSDVSKALMRKLEGVGAEPASLEHLNRIDAQTDLNSIKRTALRNRSIITILTGDWYSAHPSLQIADYVFFLTREGSPIEPGRHYITPLRVPQRDMARSKETLWLDGSTDHAD